MIIHVAMSSGRFRPEKFGGVNRWTLCGAPLKPSETVDRAAAKWMRSTNHKDAGSLCAACISKVKP